MDFKDLIEKNKEDEYLSELRGLELADAHYTLASIYCRSFANIDASNHHYLSAMGIYEKEGKIERIIDCKRDLSVNLELIGEYEQAYQGFKECLDLSYEIAYINGFNMACGGIGVLYLHLDDINNPRVEKIIELTKKFIAINPDPQLKEILELEKAIIGNQSDRLRDRVNSQKILENLIASSKYHHNRWSATRFLLMNYIDEMSMTQSTDLLERSMELFEILDKSSGDNFILSIRTKILKARLSMISEDLMVAKSSLEQVLEKLDSLAGSKVIKRFTDEVEHELREIKEHFKHWRTLIRKNIVIDKEIKKDELMQYIELAQISLKNALS